MPAGASLTGSMRRALVEPRGGVRLESAAIPEPGPRDVLVRSVFVGVCGSDTHALAGHHPFLDGPYVAGHEAVGVAVSVGDEVEGVAPGMRVILKPNLACGACRNCREERGNACADLSWVGCDTSGRWPGAMADYFVAPASNLFPVPDEVDDATAALVECLGTPVHAMRIAGDLRGAKVAVLGAGTIGALCVVAAVDAGAGAVVVTDVDASKLSRAVRIGASAAIDASTSDVPTEIRLALGGPADVVVDCVTTARSFEEGIGSVRKAGTLLVVGVPNGPTSLPMHLVQDWEIRVQGCAAYTAEDIEKAIEIAARGQLPTQELLSGTFPLTRVADAFESASSGKSGKVLIAPDAL